MNSFKSSFFKTLMLLIATFGLIHCSKKSKNAAPVAQQNNQPSPNSGNYTHYDPSEFYDNSYSNFEQAYSPTQFQAAQPKFTGALYSDSLKYTDLGNDNLMRSLKNELSLLRPSQLNAAKELARSIDFTQLVVNPLNPTHVEVRFRMINARSEERVYNLSGEFNRNRMAKIKETNVNDDSAVVVRIQCMDSANTCYQAVVKITDKDNYQTKRSAYVIFRSQPANIKFYATHPIYQYQQQNTSYLDASYVRFYKMLKNSAHLNNSSQEVRIENVILESNAVVFGGASAALYMTTLENNQRKTITTYFPLVRAQNSNYVDLSLDDYKQSIVLKDFSQRADYVTLEKAQLRLIQNNGINRVQLSVSFGAEQQNSQAVFLTVSRSNVNLRNLDNNSY